MSRQLEPYQLIERSIQKKFHKVLWTPFITAIKQYELIAPGDRIAVCISGGKDSMLMAKLLQLLQRHSDVPFEVIDLVMDPGYNAVNRQKIESNAALLHIPVTIFETNIFDVTSGIEQSPCYLCARMRRGYLYSKARELGCNKIALKPLRDKEHAVGAALGAVALGERVRKVVRIVADARDQLKTRTQMLGKRTRKVAVVAVDHDHVGIVGLVLGELRRVPAHRCRDEYAHERDEHRIDEQVERVRQRHAKRGLKGAHSDSFQRSA